MSVLELKNLQRVIFWLIKIKKCPILCRKFRNTSNSRKSCIQISGGLILFRKIDIFCRIHAFSEAFFEEKKQCALCQICHEKSHNVSDSELKVLQLDNSWFENFPTCQILTWKVYHMLSSDLGQLKSFRLWNEKFTTCQTLIGRFTTYQHLKWDCCTVSGS